MLPAAAAGGFLAYYVGGFINRATTLMAVGTLDGWVGLATDFLSEAYFGAGAIAAGFKVAPSKKRLAVGLISVVVVALALFTVVLRARQGNWQDVARSAGGLWSGGLGLWFAWRSDSLDDLAAEPG